MTYLKKSHESPNIKKIEEILSDSSEGEKDEFEELMLG